MENKKVHKNLHVAYGNNGLSIWEDGDKNFTAFITTSRKLEINNLKSFSSENLATIKELQAKGNVIVMVSPGTSKVILDPINSPTKYHINQKTGERFDISVERVNGKEYAVSNKYIFPKEPSFYPDIERKSFKNSSNSQYCVGNNNIQIGNQYNNTSQYCVGNNNVQIGNNYSTINVSNNNTQSSKKKYKLLQNSITLKGHKLYQICATRSFGDVKAGDLGGFIESEKNLSHDGTCWIGKNCCIMQNAQVSSNAQINGEVKMSENSRVHGNTVIEGKANITDNVNIHGNSVIRGNINISNKSEIQGNVVLNGNIEISGTSNISGNTIINGYNKIENQVIKGNTIINSSSSFKQNIKNRDYGNEL